MKKRIPALFLALVMALSLCPTAFAADIPMTRAKMASLMYGSVDDTLIVPDGAKIKSPFADVADNHENLDAIIYCTQNNLMAPMANGNFDPDKVMTRAEVAKVVDSLKGSGATLSTSEPTDIEGHWAKPYILSVLANGYMSVKAEGKFDPSGSAVATDVNWDKLRTEYKALPKLDDPVELKWGIDYKGGTMENGKPKEEAIPGFAAWKVKGECQNEFEVTFYNVNDPCKKVTGSTYNTGNMGNNSYGCSHFLVNCEGLPSGKYYFTIRSLGDGNNYRSSGTSISEVWDYTVPEKALAVPTDLTWDWPTAKWSAPKDLDDVWSYYVQFGFRKDESADIKKCGGSWGWTNGRTTEKISESTISNRGDGLYYFQVRTLSKDITKVRNSPVTAYSAAYDLNAVHKDVTDTLDKIEETATASDIRQAVQAIDNQKLKDAILADEAGTGVNETLTALEEKVGGKTDAAITDSLKETFDPTKVSVVGARLNDLSAGTDVTLKIDKPSSNDITIPELYNNTVTTKFSMDLQGVSNTGALKVPVKITMPIPTNINPQFLVILHFHENGETEVIERTGRNVYQKDGVWYVTFVLTSFSDFAMTQPASAEVVEPSKPEPKPEATGPKSVTIDEKDPVYMVDGDVKTFDVSTDPTGANVYWISSDTSVVSIDKGTGRAVAVSTGKATVEAHATVGKAWDSVTVWVLKSSGGGGGGGGGTITTTTTKPITSTVTNADGSTTTTKTDPKTGTVTVTTRYPGGAYTEVVKTTAGEITTTESRSDGVKTVTKENAAGKVTAEVSLPVGMTVATVTVPTSKAVTPGTVAFLVTAGGNKVVIQKSAPTEGGMSVTVNDSTKLELANNAKSFSDVSSGWFSDAVDFVSARGMMTGTSETGFSPDMTATRGMVMTLLARYEGQDTTGGENWYSKGMDWAMAKGISDGTSPEGTITREQLATMLYRYAKSQGKGFTGSWMFLMNYPDASQVSEWADEAMHWMTMKGVITGKDGGILDPQGQATRAELAVMLMRFCTAK